MHNLNQPANATPIKYKLVVTDITAATQKAANTKFIILQNYLISDKFGRIFEVHFFPL